MKGDQPSPKGGQEGRAATSRARRHDPCGQASPAAKRLAARLVRTAVASFTCGLNKFDAPNHSTSGGVLARFCSPALGIPCISGKIQGNLSETGRVVARTGSEITIASIASMQIPCCGRTGNFRTGTGNFSEGTGNFRTFERLNFCGAGGNSEPARPGPTVRLV